MPAKKNPPSPVPPIEPPLPASPEAPVPPHYQTVSFPPNQMSPSDERTWASLAHLCVLLNLFTGFGGPIAALIIYVVFRDRSRLVAYHALQSMIFQLIWWFGGGVLIGIMWAIVGTLSAILIGLILIPFAIIATIVIGLLPVGALIYGVIGGIQVSQGQDFKYWLVGDWVRGTLTGI
jgi:uncharacterized Tic20 family protein